MAPAMIPQSGPSRYRRRTAPFAVAYWRLLTKTILFATLAYFYREITSWMGFPPSSELHTAPRHLRDEAFREMLTQSGEYVPLVGYVPLPRKLGQIVGSIPDVAVTLLTQPPYSTLVLPYLLGTALLAVAASALSRR